MHTFDEEKSVEEQRAQKYDRFLLGKQIAKMICEHFRATGAGDAVLGLSDLLNVRSQSDDVQNFDAMIGPSTICQQVKHPQKWSWKGYTSQNCRILFSCRPCSLCTTKKLYETMGNQASQD